MSDSDPFTNDLERRIHEFIQWEITYNEYSLSSSAKNKSAEALNQYNKDHDFQKYINTCYGLFNEKAFNDVAALIKKTVDREKVTDDISFIKDYLIPQPIQVGQYTIPIFKSPSYTSQLLDRSTPLIYSIPFMLRIEGVKSKIDKINTERTQSLIEYLTDTRYDVTSKVSEALMGSSDEVIREMRSGDGTEQMLVDLMQTLARDSNHTSIGPGILYFSKLMIFPLIDDHRFVDSKTLREGLIQCIRDPDGKTLPDICSFVIAKWTEYIDTILDKYDEAIQERLRQIPLSSSCRLYRGDGEAGFSYPKLSFTLKRTSENKVEALQFLMNDENIAMIKRYEEAHGEAICQDERNLRHYDQESKEILDAKTAYVAILDELNSISKCVELTPITAPGYSAYIDYKKRLNDTLSYIKKIYEFEYIQDYINRLGCVWTDTYKSSEQPYDHLYKDVYDLWVRLRDVNYAISRYSSTEKSLVKPLQLTGSNAKENAELMYKYFVEEIPAQAEAQRKRTIGIVVGVIVAIIVIVVIVIVVKKNKAPQPPVEQPSETIQS